MAPPNARELGAVGAGREIMHVFLKTAVIAVALTAGAVDWARAQTEAAPTTPAGQEAATSNEDSGPAPAVRQSTPIPNDPEPPKKPRPARVPSSEELAAVMKPMAHRCFVRDVMSFYDRTHVRCYNRAQGKFSYFAVDTSQPVAETLLNKSWKSMRSGKPLTVKYAPTADLNPTNCAARDCRRLLDVVN